MSNLANVTGAVGSQSRALSTSPRQHPPFFTQADTTFAHLNHTLAVLTPLVNASKPVAIRLRPLLDQLEPFAAEAVPTLRDLSTLIKSNVPNSDLLTLMRTIVPVRNIAIGPVQADGATRQGAFPESTTALTAAAPELAFARPYAPDLEGRLQELLHLRRRRRARLRQPFGPRGQRLRQPQRRARADPRPAAPAGLRLGRLAQPA